MAQPKKKISGVLELKNISRAVKTHSAKVQTHEKYGRQLKVKGAVWEDDSISLDIYNPETKVSEIWKYRGADNKSMHNVTFTVVEDTVSMEFGNRTISETTITAVIPFSNIEEISEHVGATGSWQKYPQKVIPRIGDHQIVA